MILGSAVRVAGKLGITYIFLDTHRADDLAAAIKSLNGSPQASYVCTDPLGVANYATSTH